MVVKQRQKLLFFVRSFQINKLVLSTMYAVLVPAGLQIYELHTGLVYSNPRRPFNPKNPPLAGKMGLMVYRKNNTALEIRASAWPL